MISWIVEALLASTLLMVVVLLLRTPVRRAFGPNVAYLLWLLPVARLVLPPMPGEWQWSRLFAPMVDRLAEAQMVGGVLNGAQADPQIVAAAAMRTQIMTPAGMADILVVPPAAVEHGAPVAAIILGIWALGAVAFVGWHLIWHHSFVRSMLKGARAATDGPVRVIETDAAAGPLAFGIWRKYVAFPSDFRDRYDADEQALALAHELTHHARGDLIANWIALVVLGLHWFNPVAWRAFRAFRADQEMACDARVLAGRAEALRHAYGRAIVKSAHGGAVSAACHLHTIHELKGRLRMLSSTKKSPMRMAGGALAVFAVTLGGLGLTASGTQAAQRLRTTMGSTIGGQLAKLDQLAANAAPQAPQAVPVPPSAVAPPTTSAPAAPPAPAAPVVVTDDKDGDHVVIIRRKRPSGAKFDEKAEKTITSQIVGFESDSSAHNGEKVMKIVIQRKNGDVITNDLKGLPNMSAIPEVMSLRCEGGASEADKNVIVNEMKDGKRRLIICTDRVERLASMGAKTFADGREIERKAYRSALGGLRDARTRMAAKGGAGQAEALKAIDQAIAEVEADLAKVN